MRKLTMLGFLERYVRELADTETLNIRRLYSFVRGGNYRLKEPLFLYCYYSGKSGLLTKQLDDNDKAELDFVAENAEKNRALLPPNYQKVFESYAFISGKHNNETRIKMLMVNKIRRLQAEKNVTSYRIYTDLHINSGNFDRFIKGKDYNKISLDKSREIMTYLERL